MQVPRYNVCAVQVIHHIVRGSGMITRKDLDLLYQIEVHCEKCIRSCCYFYAVSGCSVKMWKFTQNCFGESAILHWCRVFGARKEPTHFARFFEGRVIPMKDGSRLTLDLVRQRVCKAAKMTADEYARFWKNVKNGRDKYLVHTDIDRPVHATFPNPDVLKAVALAMRDIIHDVVLREESEDSEKLKLFRDHMLWNGNKTYLKDLESDAARFKSMTETARVS